MIGKLAVAGTVAFVVASYVANEWKEAKQREYRKTHPRWTDANRWDKD